MRSSSLWLLMFALAAGLIAGCDRGGRNAINVVGSTSIQPFAEMLAEEFQKRSGISVEVQGGGSTAGLQAVVEGIATIGMCSRALGKGEEGFVPIVIARDGLAVVVHPSNPVSGLSLGQIRDMFSGRLLSWKELGGNDQPIRLITREEGSGTREAFTKLVMGDARISRKALTQESNGAVKELARHDPCAVGYMSLGLVGEDLKALAIDGVTPSADEVMGGRYPLVRPFLFVLKGDPSGPARQFIDFVLSNEGQAVLQKEGLVRAK